METDWLLVFQILCPSTPQLLLFTAHPSTVSLKWCLWQGHIPLPFAGRGFIHMLLRFSSHCCIHSHRCLSLQNSLPYWQSEMTLIMDFDIGELQCVGLLKLSLYEAYVHCTQASYGQSLLNTPYAFCFFPLSPNVLDANPLLHIVRYVFSQERFIC